MKTFQYQRKAGAGSNPLFQQITGKSRRPAVLPKLRVGAVNDPAEREADRVADHVMRMPAPMTNANHAAVNQILHGENVGRVCEDCTEEVQRVPGDLHRMEDEEEELQMKPADEVMRRVEDDEEPLQLKRADGPVYRMEDEDDIMQAKERSNQTPSLNSSSESAIRGLSGKGSPLPASERSFFEPRFGRSFADVRLHTGSAADVANSAINARAFALGRDIAFAKGEYRPGTSSGRRLMAHELTHTLQRKDSAGSVRTLRRWSKAGIQAELCSDRRAKRALRRLSWGKNPWKVISFDTAFDKWRDDKTGTETENELKGLQGNTVRGAKEIRLRKSLSDRKAASVLFHEGFHGLNPPKKNTRIASLQNEVQARVATEKLHIRQGWPESVPGYRTKKNRVDVAFIEKQILNSKHYNPKGRTRIDRRYVGEVTIGGSWKCPKKKKP